MLVVYLLLYFAAIVCFLVATFGTKSPRINLLALGLAFWTAVPLLQVFLRVT